jgi:hypothetical protein
MYFLRNFLQFILYLTIFYIIYCFLEHNRIRTEAAPELGPCGEAARAADGGHASAQR